MEIKKINYKGTKILAFDTATRITGWALFVDGKYTNSGTIDLSNNRVSDIRVGDMCMRVMNLIDTLKPTHVVIEALSTARNVATTRILSKVIGCVYCYCLVNEIPYEEYRCADWRGLLGIPNAPTAKAKAESVKIVRNKYKIDVDDNEADAINVAEVFWIKHRRTKGVKNGD